MITRGWIDNDDPRLQQDLLDEDMYLESVVKVAKDAASWDEYLGMKLDEYGESRKAPACRACSSAISSWSTTSRPARMRTGWSRN
jgi:hypothetical protein